MLLLIIVNLVLLARLVVYRFRVLDCRVLLVIMCRVVGRLSWVYFGLVEMVSWVMCFLV